MDVALESLLARFGLIATALAMVLTHWAALRKGSPNLGILVRWFRWIFVAMLGMNAALLFDYRDHPLWAVAAACFLGWFLIESIYVWLAVSALSRSDLPLFPRYAQNPRGSEWPNDDTFIRLRSWLRKAGFSTRSSLVAQHDEQELMRLVVMDRKDQQVRVTLLFFPNMRGEETLVCSFHSDAEDGIRLITDNLFVPFGGFYPESWRVERRARTRSVEKMYQRHLARCDAHGRALRPLEEDPLDEINRSSRELERLNCELGFLVPPEQFEEAGRITSPGRVRVWAEILTLSYLGKARRY